MIPTRGEAPQRATGKPRASGDDPLIVASLEQLAPVNPARAGMIPQRLLDRKPPCRKPRASGDDPWVNNTLIPSLQ